MAKYKMGPLLFCLHIINVCYGLDLSIASIGKMVAHMKDENTKSMSQLSHMHCFMECLIRKPCVFISSTYLKGDIFARDRPYKCFLYMSNESETLEVLNVCEQHNRPIRDLPQAIAGACSDHKCSTYERCLPLTGGGYRCKQERRRGNRKRPNGRKGKQHGN